MAFDREVLLGDYVSRCAFEEYNETRIFDRLEQEAIS